MEVNKKEEWMICTDDTVIEMGIPTFRKALSEAQHFRKVFIGLDVYVCKVICNAEEV